MKSPAFVLACLFYLTLPVFAQDAGGGEPVPDEEGGGDPTKKGEKKKDDESGTPGFWEAKLGGGEYVVALSTISSVSRHKYVLDGALIVDEVTIDTVGQALARFYSITPITSGLPGTAAAQLAEKAISMVDGAARTAGSGLQDMVVKKYPLTTHAKTIEYMILSESQLTGLFQSAKTSWQTGKGRVFNGR